MRNLFKKTSITWLLLFVSSFLFGQKIPELFVSSFRQEGQSFFIEYELSLKGGMKWCEVELRLSTDGGKTFRAAPLTAVTGDVGRVEYSGRKSILWRAALESALLTGNEIAFQVSSPRYHNPAPPLPTSVLITESIGVYPHLSYGAMVGFVKRVGVYVKFRSNFVSDISTYSVNDDGGTHYGHLWTTGNTKTPRMVVTGGLLARTSDLLYLYFGGGYGHRSFIVEDTDGGWGYISSSINKGFAVDGGVVLRFGIISLTAGLNWTAPSSASKSLGYFDAEVGLGVMF